jgi:MraZ protein
MSGSAEREQGMDRFVSTFTNKIDAKGRVSVPAAFRSVLERDGYGSASGPGIYCYPSLDALASLPDYSNERDELSVALYGDVQVLSIDGDGRIIIPEALRAHAGLLASGGAQVTFVGLGDKFQIWEPGAFDARRKIAREKVEQHRRLLGAAKGE